MRKFAVIGGDLRTVKLVQRHVEDENVVYTFGLEKADELKKLENVFFCSKLEDSIQNAEIIIGPIPFSSNEKEINMPFSDEKVTIKDLMHNANGRILIAGAIPKKVYEIQNEEDEECYEIVDIMKREELAILNTISTAEGTIQLMISNTNKNIHGSYVLILGFGRVAKILAYKLQGLSAKVTCAARKEDALAWIKSYGYQDININNLKSELTNYDIIINTVPNLILTKEKLKYVREDCLIIDLASNPGGVDNEAAKERGIKSIWALALPGKVSPSTTADIIKDTIYNVLKEIKI